MSTDSGWLPELMLFSQFDGKWELYLEAVYQAFCDDFIRSKPAYPGKRFAVKRMPLALDKEATFWHLIQEGKVEEERTPDFRRCERIRWPRPIIEAIASNRVHMWRNDRSGHERIVLALLDFSYVVILDDREDYVLLWTAYCVEKEHQRNKLRKEFEAWRESQKG